ncbi:hypothetical protein L227DRAFT_88609 [Lentinus tigrinus ALCF2SS1-6]|uniref:Uncharacterized protein n=1 Tax=Lentinus tigrinus ALCF2SS1-6 TaxID=1328759 RepID=A0A5C2S9H4_9APHY|nr:hypothetical protein L227DRAFT_88609 [Lentinus tigrinus ALCF2SS1-6]
MRGWLSGISTVSATMAAVWSLDQKRELTMYSFRAAPTHTVSNGMVQAPHSDGNSVMDAIAYGSISGSATRGSTSTSAHNSMMSSRFSTSEEGHRANVARLPSVSGGRTLVGASSENEKSSSAASADSRTTSPYPYPSPDGGAGETPRSSTFLLHPPQQPSPSSSPPYAPAPGSLIQPPPRTASASPRILPAPPMSPLMPPGPPGLEDTTRVSASPYAPYAYAWAVQSPTTVESGEEPGSGDGGRGRSPYAWDHPPPSSEYLPGPSSRRTTFRTSRGEALGMGVPPYPTSPAFGGMGMGVVEDGRSERSAPPMYTPSSDS